MLAEFAAFVSQRPQCRDPRPIHSAVALELNRVALRLAYYCDEGTLLVRHLTFAHQMHRTRSRNTRLRHTVVGRLRKSTLLPCATMARPFDAISAGAGGKLN
jgi:hypothetical protein